MQRATSISEMPPGACDCHMHVYDGPGIVPAPFAIPDANLVRYRALIMGYEISGGWGAAMANPDRDTFVMLGDGSYLMMNSDIYSTVLTRPQDHCCRLRQRRLRCYQPPSERKGRSLFQ
jgi:Thiamine pyrophosphate enzyme, C-terminal TPP binding domain